VAVAGMITVILLRNQCLQKL